MKIWLTSFKYENKDYAGPNIVAESREKAQIICDIEGLKLEGQLEMVHENEFDFESLERTENTVLH
jgi:hypothetical protein|tara:strand:+ start:3190 stop:3387 length:198 start_codon:yes stop_codon:yes gene_type:complete